LHREDLTMSVASRVYSTDAHKHRNTAAGRDRHRCVRRRSPAGICPFTLEAIKDCAVRKRSPRTPCLFSLEHCLGNR